MPSSKNPTGSGVPPLKPVDSKETREADKATAQAARILAARQPRSSPNPGSNR